MHQVKIHPTAFIHETVVLYPGVEVGPGAYIGPYCIIGGPAENLDTFPAQGLGVEIGPGAVVTGHVTVDSGTTRKTMVGPRSFLMKGAHVGHDAILGVGVILSCGAKIGGHAWIMAAANIGLNAVVHQWKVVGQYAMVGMGAVVTKGLEVEPVKTYAGNPARLLGINRRWAALVDDVDLMDDILREYELAKKENGPDGVR